MWSILALFSCVGPQSDLGESTASGLVQEQGGDAEGTGCAPDCTQDTTASGTATSLAAHTEVWAPERVIIIGAGPAGLAAAMDLPGALVFEASDRVGGRAPGSNQLLYFVNSVEHRHYGYEDTAEAAAAEWETLTGAPPTQATWDYLEALPGVSDRLESLGLSFKLNPPTPWEQTPRLHGAKDPGLPETLQSAWPESVDLRLNTRVTGLRIENGQVKGVEVGEDFYTASHVIIASGGFANRVDLISDYVGWEDGIWRTDGSWAGEGDAVDWAEQHGLGLAEMQAMGGYFNSVARPGESEAILLEKSGPNPFIWVNSAGERLVEEELDFSLFLANQVHEASLDGPVWTLMSWEDLSERTGAEDPSELSSVHCAESWEALGALIGVNPEGIADSLNYVAERSNRVDLNGTPCAFPPGITAAKGYGGLLVDQKQRVLDASGQPVIGLYAAGEASGMAVPGMGGLYGFDGSLSAVVWSGWRAAESINAD